MKCPHCFQEHPDNYQFCPKTGKKIELLKACPNPQCPEFGRIIIPERFNFCPYCGYEFVVSIDFESGECKKVDIESPIDDDNSELLSCPNCESENIVDNGRGYLQYTCEDCGYNWGNRNDVTCPQCGSYDIWDDGNRFENQLTCNHCGHEWGADDNEEVVDYEKNIEPSVYINKIWTEIAYENGDKGMKIHLDIDMNGLRKESIDVTTYFYYATDNPIKDTNGKYRTPDGNVATSINTYPPYSKCNYSNLTIFIPEKELHVKRECACYFIIRVWHKGKPLFTSRHVDFYITKQ